MKLKDLRIGEWIVNHDIEGQLFFRPDRVDAKTIYGFSLYIPNDIDSTASIEQQNTIIKEGEIVFLGSIERIYATLVDHAPNILHLSRFHPMGKEDESLLLNKLRHSIIEDSQ